MKISTKSIYGLMAMINLANKSEPVLLKNIAREENISEKYLEAILGELKKQGLIKTTRGVHGGYSLNTPTNQITVLEILETLEGSMVIIDMANIKNTDIGKMLNELSQIINKYLGSRNLKDFTSKEAKMYFI